MMYLLDTNVISEMRKASGTKASSARMDPTVRRWVNNSSSLDLYLSVITILELERGVHLLNRRDSVKAEFIRIWVLDRVLPSFEGRIISVDLAIAQRCAALPTSNPIEYRDSLIASTALVHGMTVVTRNVSHFEFTGVPIINPWD